MKKIYIVAIVIAVIAAVIIGSIYLQSREQAEVAVPTITGEVACLPLKEATADSTDCPAKGIKNSAGLYLAVETIAQDQLVVGEKVDVKGELTPPDEASPYAVAGTIR